MEIKTNGRTAFFYGTLMVPQILHRVINRHPTSLPTLNTTEAILHDHSRHHVRYADYPGVTHNPGSSVRGTYVTGLTDRDISRLDSFEGGQYIKRFVKVKLIKDGKEGEEVDAETYIFKDLEDLEEKEWDYETFKKEKLKRWIGTDDEYEDLLDSDADNDNEEDEVDEERSEDSQASSNPKTETYAKATATGMTFTPQVAESKIPDQKEIVEQAMKGPFVEKAGKEKTEPTEDEKKEILESAV